VSRLRAALLILAAFAALSFSGAAVAGEQTACDLRYKVVEHLARKYGEAVSASGISSVGALVEVFENPKTGTWTITVTAPGGPACLVGSGDGWRNNAAPAPPPRRNMAL
jgi:hypothetical protein